MERLNTLPAGGHAPLIVVVDDEAAIVKALCRFFRLGGHEVLGATSGPEGLAVLDGAPADLIITDMRMPGMTGVEFLQKARELVPSALRVVLTGQADLDSVIASINRGGVHRYLCKPWEDSALAALAEEAAERKRAAALRVRRENVAEAANAQLREMIELSRSNDAALAGELRDAMETLRSFEKKLAARPTDIAPEPLKSEGAARTRQQLRSVYESSSGQWHGALVTPRIDSRG